MEMYNPEVFACFKSDTWVSYRLPAGWVLCIYPHPLDPAIERSHWSVSESASPIGRHNLVRRPIEGCDWWTQSWNAAALLTTVDDAVGWQGRASDCWRSDSCKRTQVRGWSSRVFERCWLSSEWTKHKYRRWKVWENRKDVTGGIGTCVCLKVLHQKAPHFTIQYSVWSVPYMAITCIIHCITLCLHCLFRASADWVYWLFSGVEDGFEGAGPDSEWSPRRSRGAHRHQSWQWGEADLGTGAGGKEQKWPKRTKSAKKWTKLLPLGKWKALHKTCQQRILQVTILLHG